MKKANYQHTGYNKNYTGISKQENYLLSLINKTEMNVFSVNELEKISSMKKSQINNIMFSLHKKGMIIRIKKNKYAIRDNIPGHEFEIATTAIMPSYISFWSALSFYGFTEQQIFNIQLVSVKQHKPIKFLNHKIEIIKFKSKRFFGYERINNFSIASKEKSIVDSLSDFEKAGGIDEFIKCLKNSWNELNKNILVEFLLKFENKSMNSRFGFLIDILNLKISANLRKKIKKNISQNFVKLDSSKQSTNKYSNEWKIIVNTDVI